MIKDRGTKKWVALMLPEHVEAIKEELKKEKMKKKPELDEARWDEIDQLVQEGIEYQLPLEFTLFKNGEYEKHTGSIVNMDIVKNEFRIKDRENRIHFIPFSMMMNVEKV
ncbi:MAG TPA: YolD-like family protein [Niallia sp.]|nr:YolD-like family protein [Niallia sp.]